MSEIRKRTKVKKAITDGDLHTRFDPDTLDFISFSQPTHQLSAHDDIAGVSASARDDQFI